MIVVGVMAAMTAIIGVQQAAQGTQDVSGNLGGVIEAAADTGAAANQVLISAGNSLSQLGETAQ